MTVCIFVEKTNSTVFLQLFVWLLWLHVFSCSYVYVFLCNRVWEKPLFSDYLCFDIFYIYHIFFMERDSFISQYRSEG
jgi:hypothetical protein